MAGVEDQEYKEAQELKDKLARDIRLRAEFRGRVHESCTLLLGHFLSLLKSMRIDGTENPEGGALNYKLLA